MKLHRSGKYIIRVRDVENKNWNIFTSLKIENGEFVCGVECPEDRLFITPYYHKPYMANYRECNAVISTMGSVNRKVEFYTENEYFKKGGVYGNN